MSTATAPASGHPALEAIDASPGGLARDDLEATAIWLSSQQLLSAPVTDVTSDNGRAACSNQVLADLYQALADGLARLDGDRFVLTAAGQARLEAAGRRAAEAARRALRNGHAPA